MTDHQTQGRGRLGRRWEDAAGSSLLVSVLLRPAVPTERLPELSLVTAHACAEAVEDVTALQANVKEPNDVLVSGRKVAGILGEANEARVILGVGVNVNQSEAELPVETQLPATSLRIETGREVDRAELLVALLARLERRYDGWLGEVAARGTAPAG